MPVLDELYGGHADAPFHVGVAYLTGREGELGRLPLGHDGPAVSAYHEAATCQRGKVSADRNFRNLKQIAELGYDCVAALVDKANNALATFSGHEPGVRHAST